VQHELTQADIEELDDLQLEYMELFDQVPEFVGLKRPKHHFLTHIAHDAWRFAPPRGYWCFGFEAFNKVIKRGAKRSNFKREPLSIMLYYADWTARNYSCQTAASVINKYIALISFPETKKQITH
jgi:hypothetical protein